jgi:hypothetical protein
MPLLLSEVRRVSLVLYVRGFVLLALAAIALRWPDDVLFGAMLTAGVLVGALGVFELGVAGVAEASPETKRLMALHALVSIGFGAVALAAGLVPLATTVRLIAGWLLLHSVVTLAIANRVSTPRRARLLLLFAAAVNVVCALGILTYTPITFATLMYVGAGYAAAYGVAQIGTARWIWRGLADPGAGSSTPAS